MARRGRNEFRSWLQSLKDGIESAISAAEEDSPDISVNSDEIGEIIADEGWTLYDISYDMEESEWREIGENNNWTCGGIDLDDLDSHTAEKILKHGIKFWADQDHLVLAQFIRNLTGEAYRAREDYEAFREALLKEFGAEKPPEAAKPENDPPYFKMPLSPVCDAGNPAFKPEFRAQILFAAVLDDARAHLDGNSPRFALAEALWAQLDRGEREALVGHIFSTLMK